MIDRRVFIAGPLALGVAGALVPAQAARPVRRELWTFDDLQTVAGEPLKLVGAPRLMDSPWGPATRFDGVDDALIVGEHPLAGAERFTVQALFRPEGGAFEQRWFHLESAETPSVAPGTGSTRMLFEIRVVGDRWYLDAFMTGAGYRQTMMAPTKTYPVGEWHHVAQTYDGQTYRSFVNGDLQMEVDTPFVPQGPGQASIGMRLNHVAFFRGAVREIRFATEALASTQFALPKATAPLAHS
ncbi:LamG-like jellyroll fold domain-containing protein [Sphingomonas sp. BIUV-7]|uniref:LamG-like jellyroll fold domain-containing protein n=1 Tax=Sphingomonas natans TaxID=3063330 RepID=A0ABT8Y7N7_9SPHN|nr:LamG-like jellyroll fold domain-containing protein [Sphingomonas sp. BIUV-7]MDO6414339.1 LamG-like jellyroll fold domain-containing protein [Sphingomonas sp. BIUV-7]